MLKCVVDVDYEYQSLQDVIDPADFPATYKDVSRVDDLTDFPITKQNVVEAKTANWPLILTSFCFAGILTVGSVWVFRLPKNLSTPAVSDKPATSWD